jgi:hypothetical protein
MVMLACLNGDFGETNVDSLAESVVRQQHGGAFAAWAASGWNTALDQENLGKEFYRRVFQGKPLGDASRDARTLFEYHDIRRTFVLFGDPTQRLVLP